MQNNNSYSRRSMLQMLVSATVPINDHGGRIKPPVPGPDIAVVRHNRAKTRLRELLKGHGTALQLMFTECETTCPMQGAIFERVQKLMPNMAQQKLQLVSLSIDPANDTPEAMTAWLRRFHAGPTWIGAAPTVQDLIPAKTFFGRGRSSTDDHSTQVHILNREGQLVWRTIELPSAEEIAGILVKL